MKQEKKPQRKKTKQKLYQNRADPVKEEFSVQDGSFSEDTSDQETFTGDQLSDTEAGKAAKKRRNRRNAHRIRRQLSQGNSVFQKQKSDFVKDEKFGNMAFPDIGDEKVHSTEAAELFKNPVKKEETGKKTRRRKRQAAPEVIKPVNDGQNAGQKAKAEITTQKLPGQKEYQLEKVYDPKTGKTSYKMVLNRRNTGKNKGKSQGVASLNIAAKEVSAQAVDFLHEQNGEEDDNSATEATGAGVRVASRFQDFIIERADKRKPDKPVPDKTFMKEAPFAERKPKEEASELKKKAVQKRIQKQHIKREYAKAARGGGTAGKAADYARKAAKETVTAAKKVAEVIAANIHVIAIAVALILILFVIITVVSSCAAMFGGGIGDVMTGSYQSLPAEIDKAENSMTLKEMRLQNKIDRIETDYPGYDEYTYNLAEIGHDPYTLINYLSAKYVDFTADAVESEIQYLFDHMYELILTEREETRTRMVTKTRPVIDPVTGLETGEEEEYEEEEEYTAYILDVVLTAPPLETIIAPYLTGETAELYAIYKETKGAIQRFYSPLALDWQSYVKSYYGYRKNPQTGTNEFHRGLDISVPEGTSVYASQSGTVTASAYDTDYGYYIVIEDSDGYMTKYAHLGSRYVSNGETVEHGQLIGRTGSTGSITGSHLHIECLYDGDYFNPLFYFENGEGSFYAAGSPVSPTGDVAALLNEADRYVGYPYVWGGSRPSEGFDCSGFVCYVLKNSGYADISRTNAQGIYNSCQHISPSEAQPGDIIFFTGTYNSGNPVSHVGIYCGTDKMIHAGDPIKYSSINTPYWQEHFYGFGRVLH